MILSFFWQFGLLSRLFCFHFLFLTFVVPLASCRCMKQFLRAVQTILSDKILPIRDDIMIFTINEAVGLINKEPLGVRTDARVRWIKRYVSI